MFHSLEFEFRNGFCWLCLLNYRFLISLRLFTCLNIRLLWFFNIFFNLNHFTLFLNIFINILLAFFHSLLERFWFFLLHRLSLFLFNSLFFLFLSIFLHFLYVFFLFLVFVDFRQLALLRLLSVSFIKKNVFISLNMISSLFLCQLLLQFWFFLLLYLFYICLNIRYFSCLFIFLFFFLRFLLLFVTYLIIGFWFFIILPLWHIIIFLPFYLDNIKNWLSLLIGSNHLNFTFVVII